MKFEVSKRFTIHGLNAHEREFMCNLLAKGQYNWSNWDNDTFAVIFHEGSLHTIPEDDVVKFLNILDHRRKVHIYFEYTGDGRFNIIVK